jgi:hypothetical protein
MQRLADVHRAAIDKVRRFGLGELKVSGRHSRPAQRSMGKQRVPEDRYCSGSSGARSVWPGTRIPPRGVPGSMLP